ncbi:MAG: adenylate/guanylate cyclase domain-containing protein [Actinomycetes bacterium]
MRDGVLAANAAVPYVPRLTIDWLLHHPSETTRVIEGTVAFADLSGFTALSERLSGAGREGAEQLSDIIDTTFARLLTDVYDEGGRLLMFGGDALLLYFAGDGHAERAARAAHGLRRTLRTVGRHETPRGAVQLRVSIGLHSGRFAAFLVGDSHRQLLLAGGDVSSVVEAEHGASSGEIVVTQATANLLPSRCVTRRSGDVLRLVRRPAGAGGFTVDHAPDGSDSVAPQAVSVAVRDHLQLGVGLPEHRIVTVAFVQVMGLDAAVDADPAAAGRSLDAVMRTIQRACEQYGVSLLAADVDHDAAKVVLVAGAPASRGDDEQRMLLALREVVAAPLPLAVRAGVHRGSVFAGDVGPTYRRTYTVMGDTVNLAARLMARAEPNTVLASHDVVDRSRTAFALTEIEPFVAKGKRALVHAVVVGDVAQARREAVATVPSLVGREAEVETLREAWRSSVEGHGRAVEVVGEPGIGKTALLEHLLTWIGPVGHLHARGDLSASASPYQAARQLLRPVFGVGTDAADGDEGPVRDRLAGLVPDLEPWLPLVGDVLGIDLGSTPEVDALASDHRRGRQHDVVIEVMRRLATDPTVITVEDTHWLDDASADLLAALVARVAGHPWLLVTTRRDVDAGYRQAVDAGSVVRPSALDDAAAAMLVRQMGDGRPLPPAVMRRLAEQAAGNPLFLLELVTAVLDNPDLDELPDSLDVLLTARLDRLGPRDRDLVRRAAVLGSRFRDDDVRLVLGERTTWPAPSSWARLTEFVAPAGTGEMTFTHALLRDAAYGALPFGLRRELHGRVADALSSDDARNDPAVLSFHFSAAQRWDQAWASSRAAGEAAMAAYAPVEAATLLQRALTAARHLHGSIDVSDRAEVALMLARAHERSGSFDAAERAYSAVNTSTDEPLLKARTLVQRAWLAERQSRLRLGISRGRAARRMLAEVAETTPGRVQCLAAALTVEGTCWEVAGRHDRAAEVLNQAVHQAEVVGDSQTLAHAGSILDWALAMSGRIDEAVHLPTSLALYQELGDLGGQATCLTNMGALAYLRGDWQEAVRRYRQGQEVQQRSGDVTSAALGAANVGEVLSDQGHWDAALESLDEALDVWESTGHRHGVAYAAGLGGRLLARRGEHHAAEQQLRKAITLHREVGAEGDAAQVSVWLAECLMLSGDASAAVAELDAGSDDGSVTARRIRAAASLVAGDRKRAGDELRDALALTVDETDRYEQVCVTETLLLGGFDVDETVAADSEAARGGLGVVRLAVLPESYL